MRRSVLLVVFATGLLAAGNAGAATIVYPNCGTLTHCINNAAPGTTIRLRTNGTARIGNISITKGLSLEAAPGYKPMIASNSSHSTLELDPAENGATVAFRRLRFNHVALSVEFHSGTGHKVLFIGNRFKESPFEVPISSYYSGTSAGRVSVQNNRIVTGEESTPIEVRVQGGPATITGNRVYGTGTNLMYGGIFLYLAGDGIVLATVANNVVHHANDGIRLNTFAPTIVDASIFNNTVDAIGTDPGLSGPGFDLRADDGAELNAWLFNNTVSNVAGAGIFVDDAGVSVVGDKNNEFNTGPDQLNGVDIGPISNLNPRFVDRPADDFRLRAISKLVNAGQTCIDLRPLSRGDAAGRFRVARRLVDIGAYEQGSKVSASVAGQNQSGGEFGDSMVGTDGRDVLCGLGGEDEIDSLGGPDLLFGGTENDHLDARDGVRGDDTIFGGPGDDVCLADRRDRKLGCP
jgi:hypothetical protein